MALQSQISCTRCKQTKNVVHRAGDFPNICHDCRGKEADDKRASTLTKIAALPVEERLARIEAWIYDYRPTYVPPPRF